MEGQKYIARIILIIGLVLIVIQATFAQSDFKQSDYKSRIYEAYARGKMDVWYIVMHEFESTTKVSTTNEKLELINLYYGYTGWLISVDQDDLAEEYIDRSELILDEILNKEPTNPTVMAYRGAFIAYEIGISNLKAIYLGRSSMRLLEDAYKIDSNNIQANIELGNAMFYCPSAFGGDKELSIKYYKNAAAQMEKAHQIEKNWMYLNVMTALGMAYEATEQIQKAKLCYEKILLLKPNFMWVGEELYPDMIKRHNL